MDGESYELGGSREKPHRSENGYSGLFSLLSLQSKYRDGVQNIPLLTQCLQSKYKCTGTGYRISFYIVLTPRLQSKYKCTRTGYRISLYILVVLTLRLQRKYKCTRTGYRISLYKLSVLTVYTKYRVSIVLCSSQCSLYTARTLFTE